MLEKNRQIFHSLLDEDDIHEDGFSDKCRNYISHRKMSKFYSREQSLPNRSIWKWQSMPEQIMLIPLRKLQVKIIS